MATLEQACDQVLIDGLDERLKQAIRSMRGGGAIGRPCKSAEILRLVRRRAGPSSLTSLAVEAYLEALDREEEQRSKDAANDTLTG